MAGTIAATAAAVSGLAASAGALTLTIADGVPYIAELDGQDAYASWWEDLHVVQWVRIGATVMLLPDVGIGGYRALLEVGKLGREAREATDLAATSREASEAARARAARIHHPERHPGPVNRHLHRAKVLTETALAQVNAADEATARLRMITGRDLGTFQGATIGGTALFTAAPPSVLLSPEQKREDDRYEKSLTPEHGWPSDMRLTMRVTTYKQMPT